MTDELCTVIMTMVLLGSLTISRTNDIATMSPYRSSTERYRDFNCHCILHYYLFIFFNY